MTSERNGETGSDKACKLSKLNFVEKAFGKDFQEVCYDQIEPFRKTNVDSSRMIENEASLHGVGK